MVGKSLPLGEFGNSAALVRSESALPGSPSQYSRKMLWAWLWKTPKSNVNRQTARRAPLRKTTLRDTPKTLAETLGQSEPFYAALRLDQGASFSSSQIFSSG